GAGASKPGRNPDAQARHFEALVPSAEHAVTAKPGIGPEAEVQLPPGAGAHPGCVVGVEWMRVEMSSSRVGGDVLEHSGDGGEMLGLQSDQPGRDRRRGVHLAGRSMRLLAYFRRPFHQSPHVTLSPTSGPDLAIDSVSRPPRQ